MFCFIVVSDVSHMLTATAYRLVCVTLEIFKEITATRLFKNIHEIFTLRKLLVSCNHVTTVVQHSTQFMVSISHHYFQTFRILITVISCNLFHSYVLIFSYVFSSCKACHG